MKRILIAVAVAFMASGCALTVDKIDIPYEGKANIETVDGAENVTVAVQSEDKRSVYKDRVGAKKNGYGMEMAKIEATNDVAKAFANAVKFEVENLGFTIGDGGKSVTVELIRFYNDFKMGFFAGDAVADGLVNIVVANKSGVAIFTKSYEGGFINPDIQLATGSNARTALIGAMADIVGKVANDKDFHKALLE